MEIMDNKEISPDASLILIIEDCPVSIFKLTHLLEANDYRVISETDGRDGMLAIIKNKPDLVILDLGLPTANGQQVLNAIRKNPSHAWMHELPVIIYTGDRRHKTITTVVANGCSGYMVKPLSNPEKLLAKCEDLLKKD